MSGLLTRKYHRCLGIDISAQSIKIVELSRSRSLFTLEAYVIEPLPVPCSDDLTGTDPKSVARVLIQALQRVGVLARDAVVAVPDAQVICKTLAVEADLADEDLELYVRLEAEQYVPYALADVALDFEVQGCSSRHPGRVDVLLVACRQVTLDWYQAVLSSTGLKARVITVQTHGLARAIDVMAGAQLSHTIAVVDFGFQTTRLSILHQGQVIYFHELLFGSDGFDDEMFETVTVENIGRVLVLFAESGIEGVVSSILLCGAVACRAGLSPCIEARFGVPAQWANPFATMNLNPLLAPEALCCDAPVLLTACGLALMGFD